MPRLTVLAFVTVLMACTAPGSTVTIEASNTPPSAPARYEAAPVVTPVDYNMPPDLRDKICGDQYDRGGSYATVTKSNNSFCR